MTVSTKTFWFVVLIAILVVVIVVWFVPAESLSSRDLDVTESSKIVAEHLTDEECAQDDRSVATLIKTVPLAERFAQTRSIAVKRALLFGLNYRGTSSELRGCINDVTSMQAMLTKEYGYTEFIVMTDDTRVKPTRRNMMAAMRWLISKTKSGDSAFMHYSGHGASVYDTDRIKESDGRDETLVCLDYERAGMIKDDDLFDVLVKGLKPGAHLRVVVDACHSGTGADLACQYKCNGSKVKFVMNNHRAQMDKDVLYLSGCRDNQTSADAAGFDTHGRRTHFGALTRSLQNVMKKHKYKDVSIKTLLCDVHREMSRGRFTQRPEISSACKLDVNASFCLSADREY